MMRALLLLLALPLGACALMPSAPAGAPVAPPSFDTAAWLAAVRATDDPYALVQLSEDLLGAVDWQAACGEDDPTTPGRGILRLVPVSGERVLADVTCQRREVGRVFALVDLEPGRMPRLVQSFGISDAGAPTAEVVPGRFGVATYLDAGRFEILTPQAGREGCGLFARYALADDGGAAIEEVRLYDGCDAPRPVEAWPVTYSAP